MGKEFESFKLLVAAKKVESEIQARAKQQEEERQRIKNKVITKTNNTN